MSYSGDVYDFDKQEEIPNASRFASAYLEELAKGRNVELVRVQRAMTEALAKLTARNQQAYTSAPEAPPTL